MFRFASMVLRIHLTAVLAKTPNLPGNPVLLHFYGLFHLLPFNSNALFPAELEGNNLFGCRPVVAVAWQRRKRNISLRKTADRKKQVLP
jgi:hypothetical protein